MSSNGYILTSKDYRKRFRSKKYRKKNEGNQDSDASGREVRKAKKLNPLPKKVDKPFRAKYDENGCEKDTGRNLCDCLIEDCPGCWMECPYCASRKCGHECRVYRRYKYDYIEIEGADMTVRYKGK